jgi:hypothetical protein
MDSCVAKTTTKSPTELRIDNLVEPENDPRIRILIRTFHNNAMQHGDEFIKRILDGKDCQTARGLIGYAQSRGYYSGNPRLAALAADVTGHNAYRPHPRQMPEYRFSI